MKTKILLGLVFILFLVTRLIKISEIPPSVYWDEASIGYNAYSIATDLKDEWGDVLPLHFRAFGEFKLPVYIYSVVPFVKIFGLNAFAVRFPAVLYSLGTLIAIYFLAKKISGKESIGILSSFILSISPWLFVFSRTGYEATAGLFFFLLGTYLFLFVERKYIGTIGATFAFLLSFYSYNSFRIIIPVWLLLLFVFKYRNLKNLKKNVLAISASILLFALSMFPVYRLYKFDTGGVRLAQVEATSKTSIVKNYFSHFAPDFLFLKGDTNSRSQIPGHGQLFWVDLPFIILGLWMIIKSKKIMYTLPLIWILLAPIPASLTKESPHALRTILAAPGYAMISAFGIMYFAEAVKKYKFLVVSLAVLAYLMFFGSYTTDFFTNYAEKSKDDWQYQYKEIFMDKKSGEVTDKYAQPYIFALFYQKYPAQKFRDTVKLNPIDNWGFSKVASFGDFQFRELP